MKKTLYTLNIDGYAPEITALTFPLLKRYAKKIGADFFVINERKFPSYLPPVYEKFQIHELSKRHKNDWNVYFDADTLIHPNFWDVTDVITKSVTVSNGTDFTPVRFKSDKFFLRDGRFIGKGNWCLMASDWCTDIWQPLKDITFEEAVRNITVTDREEGTVIEPQHLIDDYVVSRNIARYGLKHVLIPEISAEVKVAPGLLWHQYLTNGENKVKLMKRQLMFWAAQALDAGMSGAGHFDFCIEGAQMLKAATEWNGSQDWMDYLNVVPGGLKIIAMLKKWGIECE